MSEYNYTVSLAGIPIMLRCHFPYTAFEEFSTTEKVKEIITIEPDNLSILQRYAAASELTSSQNAEYLQLMGEVGSTLLKYDRCLFHGTAFIWHKKAWIFTAPSGTGKTTQYVLWKMMYKNELSIINGDKPILEFCENRTVWVHPSPWKGKENMGIMQSAPLGGLILLKQGAENHVQRLMPSSAALPLYSQFMFLVDNLENIDRVCMLETRLLKTCPVWKLTNLGDDDSAKLMHDTLLRWEQQ